MPLNPSASPPYDALSWTLLQAARVCVAVRAGHALPEALRAQLTACDAPAARAAVQDLCYRTMRNRGRADALVQAFAQRVPKPALLRELLVVAINLLDRHGPTGQGQTSRYAPFTVVDQAVEAANVSEIQRAKNFVNAVLRNFLREHARADVSVPASAALTMNYPAWWVTRVRQSYPDAWEAILASGQQAPPLTLRINRRRTSPERYLADLAVAGIEADRIGSDAVRLKRALPVRAVPGFDAGLVSVQDEAAQRAAPLLAVQAGQRVLDACAAPGGKTCHILEQVDAEVTALDVDQARLARVAENLTRLGLTATLQAGDAAHPATWWDGTPFHRVLADLPCTASGIVRRHPDIRWLRRASDSTALSRLQQQILDALWRLVAPDGKLLIVTCSIFPEEGQLLAVDFATRHPDAVPQTTWGQLLPTSGPTIDHDGLFFAVFDKIA